MLWPPFLGLAVVRFCCSLLPAPMAPGFCLLSSVLGIHSPEIPYPTIHLSLLFSSIPFIFPGKGVARSRLRQLSLCRISFCLCLTPRCPRVLWPSLRCYLLYPSSTVRRLESFTFYCRIILSRLAQTQRFTTKSSSLVTLTQMLRLSRRIWSSEPAFWAHWSRSRWKLRVFIQRSQANLFKGKSV